MLHNSFMSTYYNFLVSLCILFEQFRRVIKTKIMEENFVNSVIELYKQKNWRLITEKFHDYSERNKLLWVFPSEDNFLFLKKFLDEFNVARLVSVGCGSGLLEWMIQEATGKQVKGIEIEGSWWRCKFAPPTFIPLIYTASELGNDVINILDNESAALLFCYFNNGPAFNDYLKYFSGEVLMIIGPGDGKGVHTNPKPFNDVDLPWRLYRWQEVRNSKDFIAIYCKD